MILNFFDKLLDILVYRHFEDPKCWPSGKLLLTSFCSLLSCPLILSIAYYSKVSDRIILHLLGTISLFLVYLSFRLAKKSKKAATEVLSIEAIVSDKKLRWKYKTYQSLAGLLSALSGYFLFAAVFGLGRGRQIRQRGKIILPQFQAKNDWTQLSLLISEIRYAREEIAKQWRENGRTEYASIAAFAGLVQEMIALGCPPALVAAANQDGLDEIRHAELCFSLAKDMDGLDIGPGTFPKSIQRSLFPRIRFLALISIATNSLIDGVLLEAVSGRIAGRLARISEDAAIQKVLKIIAADEMRHSSHAWDLVEWCIEEGGFFVYCYLSAVLSRLPNKMVIDLPAPAVDGSWEIYGIHGAAMQQEEYLRMKSDLQRRLIALKAKQFKGIGDPGLAETA